MSQHKIETICLHHGTVEDPIHKGAISPIYMFTAYQFNDVKEKKYPRYINTPNQEGLCKKIAAIEGGEHALVFGSGMAAVTTSLLSHLNSGYHVVFYNDIYGGTRNLIKKEFSNYNISYSFAAGSSVDDFKACIKKKN